VAVTSSETVTFSEFSNSLSNPVILGIVDFEPLNGSIIIDLATNLGYAILDRMLGGSGVPLDKTRDFSEIETIIIQKILVMLTQLLRDPWKNVIDITPVLSRMETNPQFAQVIAPNDMIAIVTLNMKIGDVEGFVNICLPFFTLEDVMDKLNTKYWFSTMQENHDENYEQYLETMIRRVDVPVKAVLGRSKISVADFVNLQVGDCIRLDTKVESDMDIFVGNIRKFTALPGANEDSYAVRITSVIREEE
ncbi:MAG: flagellar motor switch protein FliM, partial [Acetatifactor sp.]|nr:flagellar motor switch protein FliM [Acetatifactor sp.]